MARPFFIHHSFLPFVWSIVVSMVLLGVRFLFSSDDFYLFLPYNLFLAIIPFILSWLISVYAQKKTKSWLLLVSAGLVWLIFFPNAPYIMTDFIHLKGRSGISIWFDGVLILSFACAGLLSGYYSLYAMQKLVMRQWGKLTGWIFTASILALTSFGVYLGRFLRWNSRDLFLDPIRITHDFIARIFSPSLHIRFWMVSGLLLGFLIVSYATVFSFIQQERRK